MHCSAHVISRSDGLPEHEVQIQIMPILRENPLKSVGCSVAPRTPKLAVPGLVDLSEFATEADGVARIVLESIQELLLKLALQMARDDYETRRERQRQGVQLAKAAGKYAGRIPDAATHQRIIALRGAGQSIKRTADLAGCSESQVKRIWAI